MTIMEYIDKFVEHTNPQKPIFTDDIIEYVNAQIPQVNRNVINEYIARYARKNPDFVRYRKGIYYRSIRTPFGNAGINFAELIKRLYLIDGKNVIGYETGPSYMNKLGLTTQMPKYTYIATERAYETRAKDGICIVKPVTQVTNENYRYLQLLDMMDNRFKVRVEVENENYRFVLRDFLDRYHLHIERLINYAKLYRNKKLFEEVAEIARGEAV